MKTVVSMAILALMVATVVGPVQAKDAWYDGIYLGGGGGAGRLETTLEKLGVLPATVDPDQPNPPSSTFDPPGFAPDESLEKTSFNETTITSKFFAGYRIMDYLAVEGGYIKFHGMDDHPCFLSDKTGECTATPEVDVILEDSERAWTVDVPLDGWTAYFVGIYPFNDTVEVFGKVGAIFWEMEPVGEERVRIPASGGSGIIPCQGPGLGSPGVVPECRNEPNRSELDGTDLALGVGLNFNNASGITVRTEFEWFDIGVADRSWLLSLSAIYNF